MLMSYKYTIHKSSTTKPPCLTYTLCQDSDLTIRIEIRIVNLSSILAEIIILGGIKVSITLPTFIVFPKLANHSAGQN
jgi:hypothetical protein